jgi:5'-3' exonuclease
MRILLVDYLNCMHEGFHGHSKDPNYRFLLNMQKMLLQFRVDKIYILLEGGKSKYRLEVYPAYKAQRETARSKWTDSERGEYAKFKQEARDFAENILPLFGMIPVRVWGSEADDCAAFMVNHTDTSTNQIIMLSSDADWHQLLRPGVVQGSYSAMVKNGFPCPPEMLKSRSAFEAEQGLTVSQWVMKKCLSGDAGDNISSFDKLGDVMAVKLLQKYETLQGIKNNLDTLDIPRLSNTAKESLRDNFETIIDRNYKLMNLNFSPEEELSVIGKDGVAYLLDLLNAETSTVTLDKYTITEMCYENGWIEVLDDRFLLPFERLQK